MDKTRVLFFNPARHLAPSWTVCGQILKHLDRGRFDTSVILDREAGGAGKVPADVPLLELPLGTSPSAARPGEALALARAFARAVAWVRARDVQVIHANDDSRSMLLATLLARTTGRRLLLHFHSVPGHFRGGQRRLRRRAMRAAALNVGVSRFIADRIVEEGVPEERVRYVVNGTDPDRYHPGVDAGPLRRELQVEPDDLVVLQLARVWRRKRQEDAVRALALARRRAPGLRLVVVGWDDPRYEGPFASYREELRRLAEAEGVADRVTLLPPRPDGEALHALADVEVLPSLDDPCPLVVVEAMATGRPVVGARSGGIPEMVEDGVTGFLVPPKEPEALARCLVRLAEDPALRSGMGRAGRQRVLERHHERGVAEAFGRIYAALAAGRLPAPTAAGAGAGGRRAGRRVGEARPTGP